MLSREIASSLRGRSINLQMDVLSFEEFVRFKGTEAVNIYSSAGQSHLRHLFSLYLKQGGFPELCFTDLSEQRMVLQEYLDMMLFRSEEHTSELQSLMRISYAVFCLKK